MSRKSFSTEEKDKKIVRLKICVFKSFFKIHKKLPRNDFSFRVIVKKKFITVSSLK